MIEDAEADHIIPFSRGGKTTLENTQLATGTATGIRAIKHSQ
jgi:hypothetical protein